MYWCSWRDPKSPYFILTEAAQVLVVLLLLWLLGISHLAVQILFTIHALLRVASVLCSAAYYTYVVFNKNTNDNDRVNFWVLISISVWYFLAATDFLYLFWVWGEGAFFTNLGGHAAESVFSAWIHFFLTTVFISTGVGFALYVPVHIGSEFACTFVVIFGFALSTFLLATSIGVVLDNISKAGGGARDCSNKHKHNKKKKCCGRHKQSVVCGCATCWREGGCSLVGGGGHVSKSSDISDNDLSL